MPPLICDILFRILTDNLRLRKSMVPLSTKRATGWAKGLNIPRGGETVLYTGHMYQLMPSIASMEARITEMQDSWGPKSMRLGRLVNRFINTSWFVVHPSQAEQEAFDHRLQNIARLLKIAGVPFGYLYENELFAGAVMRGQGMDRVFQKHARRVYATFKKAGVRRVITVDPHTTDLLRTVYPKYIPAFDLEVRNYLEVLSETGLATRPSMGQAVVLHDSCIYTGEQKILAQQRALLEKAGFVLCEQPNFGKRSMCCRGPIASLFQEGDKGATAARLAQLENSGCKLAVTVCPVCLLNLQHAANGNGIKVRDISEYLAPVYCDCLPIGQDGI